MSILPSRVAAVVASAVVLMLMTAWPASAQGFYYKEIRKDERIYVFNNAEEAERFEKSGEMGRSITRLGAGPNGETVVADSERALQLFFFKYGISEPVPEPPPPPAPAPPWRLSGYIFGDYYYFAEHHDPKWQDQQGFWIRRVYFTYDHNLGARVTTRLRLEMNSSGRLETTTLTAYVKDAYLRWTYLGRQQMTLGIQPTSMIEFVESIWGLRHIEKTPVDLYRTDSSRDFGVGLSGPVNDSQTVRYSVQVGNDSGQSSEVNANKALRMAARYEANPGFVAEGFFGFLDRPDASGDRLMGQGFVGYRHKRGRAGFQYYRQVRRAPAGTTRADLNLDVFSGFGVLDLRPQKWTAYGRVDRFDDPNPDGAAIEYLPLATNAKYTFVLAGLEYYLLNSVRVGPNVEWVTYDEPATGTKPRDDVVLRVTFYWVW